MPGICWRGLNSPRSAWSLSRRSDGRVCPADPGLEGRDMAANRRYLRQVRRRVAAFLHDQGFESCGDFAFRRRNGRGDVGVVEFQPYFGYTLEDEYFFLNASVSLRRFRDYLNEEEPTRAEGPWFHRVPPTGVHESLMNAWMFQPETVESCAGAVREQLSNSGLQWITDRLDPDAFLEIARAALDNIALSILLLEFGPSDELTKAVIAARHNPEFGAYVHAQAQAQRANLVSIGRLLDISSDINDRD